MRNLVAILLLALGLFSCCTSTKDVAEVCSETLVVPKQLAVTPVTRSSLIGSFSIIHPDKDIVIGNVSKIVLADSLLCILDRKAMMVNVLDMSGRRVYTISSKGHGYREYGDLSDFFVDKHAHTLNIVSRYDKKLLTYDLHCGKLKSVRKLPKMFSAMQKTPTGYMGYMANYTEDKTHPYNFWILNDSLKTQAGNVKISPMMESRYNSDRPAFSEYCGVSYGVCQRDFNVYKFYNQHYTCMYHMDFDGLQLPDDFEEGQNDRETEMKTLMTHISDIERFQETKRYVFCLINFQGQRLLVAYDKQTEKISKYELDACHSAVYPLTFGNVVGSDENHIISIVDALDVERLCKGKDQNNDYEKKYPKQIRNLRSLVNYPFNNNNPFVIVYTINNMDQLQ